MARVSASLEAVHSSLCRIVGADIEDALSASAKINAFDIDEELVRKSTIVSDLFLNWIREDNDITRWRLDQMVSDKTPLIATIESQIANGKDVLSLNVVSSGFLRLNLNEEEYDLKLGRFSSSIHATDFGGIEWIRTQGAGGEGGLQDVVCCVRGVASVFFTIHDLLFDEEDTITRTGCIFSMMFVRHDPAAWPLMGFLKKFSLSSPDTILGALQGVDCLMLKRYENRIVPVTLREMYVRTFINPESLSIMLNGDLATKPEFWDCFFRLFFDNVDSWDISDGGVVPFALFKDNKRIIYTASVQQKQAKFCIEVYESNSFAGYFNIIVPAVLPT